VCHPQLHDVRAVATGNIGLENPNIFEHRWRTRRADLPGCRDKSFQTHNRREQGLAARLMVAKIGLVNR
jgi:hypothetical protein